MTAITELKACLENEKNSITKAMIETLNDLETDNERATVNEIHRLKGRLIEVESILSYLKSIDANLEHLNQRAAITVEKDGEEATYFIWFYLNLKDFNMVNGNLYKNGQYLGKIKEIE